MAVRMYKLDGGTGAKGAVIAMVIIGLGVVVVGFGLVLLLALGTAAAAIGAGVVLYRRLTGQSSRSVRGAGAGARLDPSLEVFSSEPVITDRTVRERPDSLPPG